MSEQEVTQEAEAEAPAEKEGTQFVEFDSPEVEKRFRRVYGNMKEYERQNQQLVRDQKALLQKTQTLEEKLASIEQDSTDQRLESLRTEKAAAYEAGEIDKVLEIDEKILDARVKTSTPEPKAEPAPEPEPEGLSPELQHAIDAWSNEVDDGGQYIRPWSHPTHPLYSKALPIAETVLKDPDMQGADTEDFLKEIEKRVTKVFDLNQPKPRGQTVLANDGDVTPKSGKGVKLNPEQKQVAWRMFPKLSQAEAEKKYAGALG